MKKQYMLCLLLSTLLISASVFAQNNEMTLQLNKDNQTIIDPISGEMFVLDQSSINNTGCQSTLGTNAGYFFINQKTRIINAENCYEYAKRSSSNNTQTGNINTGTTNTGTTTPGNISTGNINTGTTNTDTENYPTNSTPTDSYQSNPNISEYENAIQWLYKNGATKFNSVETFGGDVAFTREQGAKIVLQVAKLLKYKTPGNSDCNFSDIQKAHTGLTLWISESCNYGIFKGDQGKFLPKEPFSQAQVLAVLTKIIQHNNIGETTDPWWQQFFDKTKSLGLLTDMNIDESSIYNTVTRKEIAILLYRLRNLMRSTTSLGGAGEITDKDIIVNTDSLSNQPLSFENDPEFIIALSFMVDNGMTSIDNPSEFRPLSYLEKQQWAKFTSVFHQKFFGANNDGGIPEECFYEDLEDADQYAKSDIVYMCKEKLVSESSTFKPKTYVTHADFIISIIKMLGIEVVASSGVDATYREPYYTKAFELGIVSNTDKLKFAEPITRFEAALHYYRLFIRYKFLENYEQDTSSINNIVSVFDDSNKEEISNPQTQKKIAINAGKLLEETGRIGIIELIDNQKYTLQKEKSTNIYNSSNNWFGSLYSIDTDEKVGIVNFLMNVETQSIIYGSIRMNDGRIYEIIPSTLTKAYYIMTLTHNADKTD